MQKLLIIFIMLALTACGTTKVFHKECERVENGFICVEE